MLPAQVGGFSHRAIPSCGRALQSCPHATVHWSPMGGGMRQYNMPGKNSAVTDLLLVVPFAWLKWFIYFWECTNVLFWASCKPPHKSTVLQSVRAYSFMFLIHVMCHPWDGPAVKLLKSNFLEHSWLSSYRKLKVVSKFNGEEIHSRKDHFIWYVRSKSCVMKNQSD